MKVVTPHYHRLRLSGILSRSICFVHSLITQSITRAYPFVRSVLPAVSCGSYHYGLSIVSSVNYYFHFVDIYLFISNYLNVLENILCSLLHTLVRNMKLKISSDRRSVGQSILVSGSYLEIFLFCLTIVGFLILSTLSDERMGLYFTCTVASGPCQSSHSRVRVPQNSRPYFTFSLETAQTCKARSQYLYPPGIWWPSYTPPPRTLCSSFVVSYNSQDYYGGGILTRLHMGLLEIFSV
jgi:hypothetical protein